VPDVGQSSGGRKQAPVLVGTAGWAYDDWKNVVYPAGERNKLKFVSRYMDCVEVNVSFYRPLSPQVTEKWLGDVGDEENFRFIVKLWQRFTHQTDPPVSDAELSAYKEGLKPLEEAGKLLAVLVQFPFYFCDSTKSRSRLGHIAESFSEYVKVLEVRDRSWSKPEALEFIRANRFNLACLDMPWARNSFRERALVTGTLGYLRLHGRNRDAWFSKDADRDQRYNYLYSDHEMNQVLHRIEEMRKLSQRLVVIWNNHYQGKAMTNACQTLSNLKGGRVRVPPLLKQVYPELDGVAIPEAGRLF